MTKTAGALGGRPQVTARVVLLVAATLALTCGHAEENAPPALAATTTVDLGHGCAMEFVLIRPGTFQMGSPPEIGDDDERPQHTVRITKPFYIGKYEVTQAQWVAVMGDNPSDFKDLARPVDTVSWNDCQRFLVRVRARSTFTVVLPTEAEWEYACRAGSATRWNWGENEAEANDYAWFQDNSGGTSHPVGTKKPNAWGIYDLLGNVGEWCADRYANPYPQGDATDPAGASQGDSRVARGGAWGDHPVNFRCAYRNANGADGAHNGIGFRCVLRIEELRRP